MSDTILSDPEPSDPAPAPADPAPAPSGDFSLYGEGGVREELSQYFTDDNKAARSVFEKYATAEDPNKAFIDGIANLQYMASQKAFSRPPEDAPESVVSEFNQKLRDLNGAPKDLEGYEAAKPEGLDDSLWQDDEINAYRELFHKHGASEALWKEAMELYGNGLMSIPDEVANQQHANVQQEMEALKSQHGLETDKVIADTSRFGRQVANLAGISEDGLQRIFSTAEGVNLMHFLSKSISPDVISTVGSAEGMSANGGVQGNYEEMARQAGKDAFEAMEKGDNAAYDKAVERQRHFNALHIRKQG